jgi:hypothetical protein
VEAGRKSLDQFGVTSDDGHYVVLNRKEAVFGTGD